VDAVTGFGVDYLVTANNHTVDRGKNGIIRTIDVLNQKGVPFAGAYKDQAHRDSKYPLLIEKNGFRLALLNYTYGTNGIPVPSPTIVNLIDTALIRADYQKAVAMDVDEVIVCIHWGEEYKLSPSRQQLMLTNFMHNLGIRLVIGSHPHVIQRMEASFDTDTTEGRVVVYSLGNFVSNMRKRYTDGGVISVVELVKENGKSRITNAGYIPVWVQTPVIDGKDKFKVLPVSQFERQPEGLSSDDIYLMNRFATDSRELFNAENYNFPEILYKHDRWIIPWQIETPVMPISIKPLKEYCKKVSVPTKILF
jgi:poly-gamma-glutamate synthesis protein (capsule biosynthesis protein)